jgi:hypothetical protein
MCYEMAQQYEDKEESDDDGAEAEGSSLVVIERGEAVTQGLFGRWLEECDGKVACGRRGAGGDDDGWECRFFSDLV